MATRIGFSVTSHRSAKVAKQGDDDLPINHITECGLAAITVLELNVPDSPAQGVHVNHMISLCQPHDESER